MRRWSCFIICILLIGALAVPAMAAGGTQMTISASQENAKPGEEITFTVTISGSDPCKSYGLKLEYDESVYALVDGECTVEGAMIGTFLPGKGFAVLYGQETVPEGTLGTFTLKVKETAKGGSTEVSGTPAVKNGSTSLDANVTGTQVSISAPEGASVPKETTVSQNPTVPKDITVTEEPTVPKGTTASKDTTTTKDTTVSKDTTTTKDTAVSKDTASQESAAPAENIEQKPGPPTPGNSGSTSQSPFDQNWQSKTGSKAQAAARETAALEQEAAAAVQTAPVVSEAPSESGGSVWLIAAAAVVLVICAGALAVILVRKKKRKYSKV